MRPTQSLALLLSLLCPSPAAVAQMATADRVQEAGWWPTKAAPRGDFAGPARCAECHLPRAGQQATAMAQTASRAGDADVLRSHDRLGFTLGSYSYSIEPGEDGSVYTVSDGQDSASATLDWAFGVGKVGQSYLFERDGQLHEARVSYYDAIGGLDFTPKRALAAARDVEEAMARPVHDAEAVRCFGCHTTASRTPSGLDTASLIPGITCEACHGPGRAHAERMGQEIWAEPGEAILNPEALSPADSVDFCGACHGTFWDVMLAGETGLAALRSQPFRLQSSACWQKGDARLTCVSCHDPHEPLVRSPVAYDQQCLSCHSSSTQGRENPRLGSSCRIGTRECVSCHMPKYEVPEMHFSFTDHLIRVVREGGTDSGR